MKREGREAGRRAGKGGGEEAEAGRWCVSLLVWVDRLFGQDVRVCMGHQLCMHTALSLSLSISLSHALSYLILRSHRCMIGFAVSLARALSLSLALRSLSL